MTSDKITKNFLKVAKMSKSYRIREEESETLKEMRLKLIIETKLDIKESDILHVLIRNHLKNINSKEIIKYRAEVLKKED